MQASSVMDDCHCLMQTAFYVIDKSQKALHDILSANISLQITSWNRKRHLYQHLLDRKMAI